MGRLVLDLPRLVARGTVLDTAATELRERGITGWRGLELRSTEPTGSALIRRFTFTYWTSRSTTRRPGIDYARLWAHLDGSERSTLVKAAAGLTLTGTMEQSLVRAAGPDFLIHGPDGSHRLPLSFRAFLHAMSTQPR